jgi:hypothetical protein
MRKITDPAASTTARWNSGSIAPPVPKQQPCIYSPHQNVLLEALVATKRKGGDGLR